MAQTLVSPGHAASLDPDVLRRLIVAISSADIEGLIEPQTVAAAAVTDADAKVESVIVSVHGIGDQSRNATALATAIRFCDHFRYEGGISLGAFEPAPGVRPGFVIPEPPCAQNLSNVMAFVEAHWADIPRRIARDGYTLQETKAWARVIVARVRSLAMLRNRDADIDYRRIRLALEEMIEAIGVVESLLFLTRKAGLGDFNLKALLDDFLGDVQLVTEFAAARTRIVGRFVGTMQAVAAKYPRAKLFVVAHSEGTVVSFLGMLKAADDPLKDEHAWIDRVGGFMTIGSPIDKHLILWPELFELHRGPRVRLAIPWRNYVDYADPVGFNLDTARRWLHDRHYDQVFSFRDADDFSFRRYALPGKAHVEYWNDPEVFGHFINTLVKPPSEPALEQQRPPRSKPWIPYVSFGVGYLLPLALIHVGVYILVAAVTSFYDPKGTAAHPNFIATVLGLAWLVAGTTVWLRIVRLTRSWAWFGCGLGLYLLFAAGYFWMLSRIDPRAPVNELAWFDRLALQVGLPLGVTPFVGSLLTIAVVLVVSLPRRHRKHPTPPASSDRMPSPPPATVAP